MKPRKPGRPPTPASERKRQVSYRLPIALLERIDAYTERLNQEQPGSELKTTNAVKRLLTDALDRADAGK